MRSGTTSPATWIRLGTVLTAFGALALASGATLAGAAAGWSRTPAAGLGGATVHVASSSSTLCHRAGTAAPTASATDPSTDARPDRARGGPAGDTTASATVDGSRVELRLERAGATVPVGSVAVTPGGAWAGDLTVPPPAQAPAGDYRLIPRCVVDSPGGADGFDFDGQPFGVVESPPPTTVTAPPTIPPPVTPTAPTEVAGVQVRRPAATTTPQPPTLPRTGDGTLAVALAGAAAVLVGAVALWWGARASRRAGIGTR